MTKAVISNTLRAKQAASKHEGVCGYERRKAREVLQRVRVDAVYRWHLAKDQSFLRTAETFEISETTARRYFNEGKAREVALRVWEQMCQRQNDRRAANRSSAI